MNEKHEQDEPMMKPDGEALKLPADVQLDPLLDEALSAAAASGGIPDGLADRIVAATADRLPGRRRDVIGRIGPARLGTAIAAAAAIAIGLTIWFSAMPSGGNGSTEGALASIEDEVEYVVSSAALNDPFDQRLSSLQTRVQTVRQSGDWSDIDIALASW